MRYSRRGGLVIQGGLAIRNERLGADDMKRDEGVIHTGLNRIMKPRLQDSSWVTGTKETISCQRETWTQGLKRENESELTGEGADGQ